MLKMNLWDAKWDLDEAQCPCDIHFNQWIEANKVAGKTIYHFGTGTHHVVGIAQAANGLGNFVLAITASIVEYETYIKLVSADHHIARHYVAYFGDIYIGSIGMEGAFDAMGTGEVDLNWAKEHHSLWVEEEQAKGHAPAAGSHAQPAE